MSTSGSDRSLPSSSGGEAERDSTPFRPGVVEPGTKWSAQQGVGASASWRRPRTPARGRRTYRAAARCGRSVASGGPRLFLFLWVAGSPEKRTLRRLPSGYLNHAESVDLVVPVDRGNSSFRRSRPHGSCSAPPWTADHLPVPATVLRAVPIRVVAAQPNVAALGGADPRGSKGAKGVVGPWRSTLHGLSCLPARDHQVSIVPSSWRAETSVPSMRSRRWCTS